MTFKMEQIGPTPEKPFQYSFESVIKYSIFLTNFKFIFQQLKFSKFIFQQLQFSKFIFQQLCTIFRIFLTKPFHEHKIQNPHLKIISAFYSTNTN